jgi:hypothetical protein
MDKPTQHYMRDFFVTMASYGITIIVSITLINRLQNDSFWRIPLALLPAIPIIFMLMAFLRYLNEIDELQQRIQLHAIGFATGAISLLSFAYGLLENVGFPQLSYFWIFPATVILWGGALSYYTRRYA